MTKEQEKKLAEALRSGKFEQYRESLTNARNDKHCCLGVACVVFEDEAGGEWNKRTFVSKKNINNKSDAVLPLFMCDFLNMTGVGELTVYVSYNGVVRTSLAELNDAGMSFAEIADVIESGKVKDNIY